MVNLLMLSWEYPPHVVGGLAAHLQGLSRALAARGHSVTVLTQDAATAREHEDQGVHVIRMGPPPVRPTNFMDFVHQLNEQMLAKAVRLVSEGRRFDLVHAHDWIVAFAAAGLKQSLRLPLLATVHATEYGRNGGLHTDEQRHISDIEWWLIYEAWHVIVCSRAMQRELEHVFQAPEDKVTVIPNGIESAAARPQPDMALRREYAADDEDLILFVGRLVFEKGVDVLLYAFAYLLAVRPKARLIVAGQGAFAADLEELARRLGIAHRVHFVGHIDAARRDRLLAVADAAVFPSRYEPFGIVALEAMALGVPVVVGDAGGLKEVVRDGEDGFRVAPGDAGALSAALYNLLADRNRARRMAESARRRVETVFTWSSVAEATERLYGKVMDAYRRSTWHGQDELSGKAKEQPAGYRDRAAALLRR